MIVRLVLGIGLAALTYWLLRRLLGKYQLSVKQFFAIYGLALGALILIALALSGRLHPIAAALGVALTMGARILPWIMRGLQAMNLMRAFGAMRNAQGVHKGPKDGATSEVMSEYLSMKLDHDAGSIDGRVLKGSYEGARLSALRLEDLLQLRGNWQSTMNPCNSWMPFYHESIQIGMSKARHMQIEQLLMNSRLRSIASNSTGHARNRT